MKPVLVPVYLLGVVLAWVPAAAPASDAFEFELEQLAEGVYVAIRPESIRIPVEGNATVLINDRDVVVVEGGGLPLAAERVLAKIRELTDKPVRYVINSHWHGDHHLGNQVYRQAFPGVEIISHRFTREDITGPAMDYLAEQAEALPQQHESIRQQLEAGTFADGTPLDERTRRWFEQMAEALPLIGEEIERLEISPPTLTFDESLTLHRGERTIEIRFLGRGNTRGDAVVYLPKERIVITGDLVVLPTPYGFGTYPGDWIETLSAIQELEFDYLVPGHGPVQTDASYLDTLKALFADMRKQTQELVADGADLERVRAEIDVSEFEAGLCGDDRLLRGLFRRWFVSPFTLSTYKEVKGEPIVQGQEG